MRTNPRVLALSIALVGGILSAAQPSSAIEPTDNTIPWAKNSMWAGNASFYNVNTYNGAGFWSETIGSSTDVDYHVAACGGGHLITDLGINLNNASGDLDIQVYTVDGALVGSSAGTGNFEHVSLSGKNTSAAVVKVWGYLGATNTYNVNVNCM